MRFFFSSHKDATANVGPHPLPPWEVKDCSRFSSEHWSHVKAFKILLFFTFIFKITIIFFILWVIMKWKESDPSNKLTVQPLDWSEKRRLFIPVVMLPGPGPGATSGPRRGTRSGAGSGAGSGAATRSRGGFCEFGHHCIRPTSKLSHTSKVESS